MHAGTSELSTYIPGQGSFRKDQVQ